MNAFTADMAKELSKISRNNHSGIMERIIYHSLLGHNFIMLTKYDLYYKDAVEKKDELRKNGFNILEYLDGITIDWRE